MGPLPQDHGKQDRAEFDQSKSPDAGISDEMKRSESSVETEFSVNLGFHVNELNFIEQHRTKLRLFDPAGIYQFRHIQLGFFQSFFQLITFIISFFFFLFYY